MKRVLANAALLSGGIGFAGFILIIIASKFGCCAGLTTRSFNLTVLAILAVSVLLFILCMVNNCCRRG